MNSPFSNLYEQLIARIKDQVPSIRYINQDLGQLENYNPSTGRPSVTYPCILIDFDNFTANDLGEAAQTLEGEVIIRLALDTWTNASSLSSPELREKSLKYFDVEFDIYRSLSRWSADSLYDDNNELIAHYGALSRTATSTEKRDDGLRVRVIKFQTSIEDYSVTERLRKTAATAEITS